MFSLCSYLAMPKQYSPWYDSDIEQSRLLAALPKLAAFAVLPNKLFLTRQCRAVIWPSWRSGKRLTTTLNARWGSVNIFGGAHTARDVGGGEGRDSVVPVRLRLGYSLISLPQPSSSSSTTIFTPQESFSKYLKSRDLTLPL
jgi:hypothetical protein